MAEDQDFALSAWTLLAQEALLPVLAQAIGCTAAVIPAWRAYRIDIADTLARWTLELTHEIRRWNGCAGPP